MLDPGLPSATTALLGVVVAVSQTVETVTGFGGTVMSLSLGAHLMSLDALVVSLVLLNLLQNAWLVVRGRKHLQLRLLLTRIVPLCGVGLAIGATLFRLLGTAGLKPVLGAFVVTAAALELVRLMRKTQPAPSALHPVASAALLIGGGIFHGLFASGGPLVVYYASRALPDKQAFRATLSLLWLILNSTLLVSFALGGQLTRSAAWLSVLLLPALGLGIVLGEIVHHRVDETKFRKLVQGVLLATGIFLLL